MNTTISYEEKQLLVYAALAAANHGLKKQADEIMALFPQIITVEEDRHICRGIIYFALNEKQSAECELAQCTSAAAQELLSIFMGTGPQPNRAQILS